MLHHRNTRGLVSACFAFDDLGGQVSNTVVAKYGRVSFPAGINLGKDLSS